MSSVHPRKLLNFPSWPAAAVRSRPSWLASPARRRQHWIQLLNPMLNPSLTNTHAQCVDCPYSNDEGPDGEAVFWGLQYDGTDHLLDGDSNGAYLELGAEGKINGQYAMLGPQYRNDAGDPEYPQVTHWGGRRRGPRQMPSEGPACRRLLEGGGARCLHTDSFYLLSRYGIEGAGVTTDVGGTRVPSHAHRLTWQRVPLASRLGGGALRSAW